MLFGKHINRYYIRYLPHFLIGVLALLLVDYMQLVVPELYRTVINGMTYGTAEVDGVTVPFDMPFLLDKVCLPLITVIVTLVVGRFVWRICFLGAGVGMETSLRGKMFDRCKDLSPQYYQVNKVGGLMSLFTNDLDTVQECFGWAVLMFCDAAFLGVMALVKMFRMNPLLAIFSMIPMAFMLSATLIVGWFMTEKWKTRQAAFSSLSDFAQESFSGIAVVKAFVKESVELWRFKKLNQENETANVRYTRASVLLRVSITLFIESVMCVILGYGGYLVYLGKFNADTFFDDQHPTLKADFVMANPPFNLSDWGGNRLTDDVRWKYGTPPDGNANFAWIQHIIHHLAPSGRAGVVLANGSLSSQTSGEGDIRQRLVEADLVDCIIAMPSQLFYTTGIPVSIWFFNRRKKQQGQTLFIDAREMGTMVTRKLRELTEEDIMRIAHTYQAYAAGTLTDEKGFCAVKSIKDIAEQDFILTPGRYVGIAEQEQDAEPFEEKMTRFTTELASLFEQSHTLEEEIKKQLESIGYKL